MTEADDRAAVLTGLARAAIAERLGARVPRPGVDAPWLAEQAACFVTLTRAGRLRGCIGSLSAYRSLVDDVRANAVAAATRDPRFEPLPLAELADTHIEVSVLSEAEPLPVADEADALARLRPHVDGVILTEGGHRGTFLPQVWEQLSDPRDFLRALKRKAGLPESHWSDAIRLQRYTVTAYHEPTDPEPPEHSQP